MKAQFQAMETIFVMIIISMLLITGYAIYSKISTDNFTNKQASLEKARQAKINSLISNLPEFKCTTLSVSEVGCIDELKAESFKLLLDEDEFKVYSELFGTTTIVLQKINVLTGMTQDYTIYNNSLTEFKSKQVIYNPVLINNPISRKSSFGLLISTFYESTN